MTQENPQNPITKAHLEGVEQLENLSAANQEAIEPETDVWFCGPDREHWENGYYAGIEFAKSFLTTYGINLLKAAKEAGQKGYTFEEVDWGGGLTSTEPVEDKTKSLHYAQGFNSCLSSYISAIDEGIRGIKEGRI